MQKNVRLRLLSNFVILFSLLAIAWWSVLLFSKNREAFRARVAESRLLMIADGTIQNADQYYQTEFYQKLENKYDRQEWMILGEAVVFVFSLVIGVFLINKGYNNAIEAAQQRRNFLLSITHELKSPIASINLVLDTFIKRELNSEQTQKLANNALRESHRLHDLVNDLLLAARLESTYTPNLEETDLTRLVQRIIDGLRTKYPRVQFDFRHAEEPVMARVDRNGLRSVVLNLLENAVKYGSKPIHITTVLRSRGDLGSWLEIADNGIGIPDEEKDKIFKRFYRVGSEDTRTTKGTGLGLYIVRQTVLAHGGTISVADNRPRGTIFTITLPRNAAA